MSRSHVGQHFSRFSPTRDPPIVSPLTPPITSKNTRQFSYLAAFDFDSLLVLEVRITFPRIGFPQQAIRVPNLWELLPIAKYIELLIASKPLEYFCFDDCKSAVQEKWKLH
jgi:hypothetical protein